MIPLPGSLAMATPSPRQTKSIRSLYFKNPSPNLRSKYPAAPAPSIKVALSGPVAPTTPQPVYISANPSSGAFTDSPITPNSAFRRDNGYTLSSFGEPSFDGYLPSIESSITPQVDRINASKIRRGKYLTQTGCLRGIEPPATPTVKGIQTSAQSATPATLESSPGLKRKEPKQTETTSSPSAKKAKRGIRGLPLSPSKLASARLSPPDRASFIEGLAHLDKTFEDIATSFRLRDKTNIDGVESPIERMKRLRAAAAQDIVDVDDYPEIPSEDEESLCNRMYAPTPPLIAPATTKPESKRQGQRGELPPSPGLRKARKPIPTEFLNEEERKRIRMRRVSAWHDKASSSPI